MTRAGLLLALLVTSGCAAATPLQFQVSPGQVALVDIATGDTVAHSSGNGVAGTFTVDPAGRDNLEGRLVCPPFDDLAIHFRWSADQGWMLLSPGPPQSVQSLPPLCLSRTLHLNVRPADTTIYERLDTPSQASKDLKEVVAGVGYAVRALPHGNEGYCVPHAWSPPTLVLAHPGFRSRLWVIPNGALAAPGPLYPTTPIELSPLYGPFSYPWVDGTVLLAGVGAATGLVRRRRARTVARQMRQQALALALPQTSTADTPETLRTDTGRTYRLDSRLGQRGMGSVYVAVPENHSSTGDDERVAIKLLLQSMLADAECVMRFLREVRICASLHHPALVKVLDWGTWTNRVGQQIPFTVLELVEGRTLGQVRHDEGRIEEARVVRWLTEALQGLQVAHDANIIHRDIKPDNLMLTISGQLKILDFGIAHITGATVTATGTVMGTPRYMAPEQFDARALPATDLHALGLVAYELLTGKSALPPDQPFASVTRLTDDDIPPIQWAAPHVSAAVADIVMRMMAPAIKNRFASCSEVLQALHGDVA